MRDLPPKLEVVLEFSPTGLQLEMLTRLLDIIPKHGNQNTLRDTEVGKTLRGGGTRCWGLVWGPGSRTSVAGAVGNPVW